jgi:hypothetical protein
MSDLLASLCQSAIGTLLLAIVNRYCFHRSWPVALLFGALVMACFWLGQRAGDEFQKRFGMSEGR